MIEKIFSSQTPAFKRKRAWDTLFFAFGLILNDGNKQRTADFLGVSVKGLYDKINLNEELKDICDNFDFNKGEDFMGTLKNDYRNAATKMYNNYMENKIKKTITWIQASNEERKEIAERVKRLFL